MTPPKPPNLSDEEIIRVRAMLDQDKFVRQFWASVRTWVIAIAAVVAGITVGFEALFRSRIEREQKEKQERERRKIAALLRDITDPAEAVGECLIEEPKKPDHDATQRIQPRASLD